MLPAINSLNHTNGHKINRANVLKASNINSMNSLYIVLLSIKKIIHFLDLFIYNIRTTLEMFLISAG